MVFSFTEGTSAWQKYKAEMKVLGIDFSCALGALSNGQFPEKDCLLPLISKLLGYAIVAASTTVKLPQARSFSAVLFFFFFVL